MHLEFNSNLAGILESTEDAIIGMSLVGTIQSWNKGSEKMFGYTSKEMIGNNISLIIPPECINDDNNYLSRISNNEIVDCYETTIIKKNGKHLHVSLIVAYLKDSAGNITGVLQVVRDITSRKKNEAELIEAIKELTFQNEEKEKRAEELLIANKELALQNEEKEKRANELMIANEKLAFENDAKHKRAEELLIANHKYKYLFDNNPSPLFIFDFESLKIIDCNIECLMLYGYSREEFLQLTIKDIRPEEDIDLILKTTENESAYGEIHKKVWRHLKKNGERMYVEITGHLLDYNNRRSSLVHINDISANIELEKKQKEAEQKLSASLKEIADYKYALDQSSIVEITDQKGIIKYVNDNFLNISKFSREELIGEDHRIMSSGHHSSSFIKNLWVTIAKGKIWKGELKNKAKNGSTYWVDTTIVPFLDSEGKPYQYIAIRADITERKKAEEKFSKTADALQKAFNDTNKIMDSSLDIICVVDKEGCFVKVSAACEAIWGYKPEELIGKPLINYVYNKDNEKTQRTADIVMSGKSIKHFENRYIRKDGSLVDMEWTARWDENDKLRYGVARDITERKIAAGKIIESDNRMRLATSSAAMGIWYWDNKNNKMVWDKKLYQIYDINESQLGSVYEGWLSRLHPEDKDRVNEVMQTAIAAKKREYGSEFRIIWNDLSVHYIKGTGITEYDYNGNVIGMMGVNWDITESKKAEIKLIENENYLRSILDNEPECVKVLNSNGELLSMNPAGLAMIEADNEQQVLGHRMSDLVNKKYQLGFKRLSKKVFKGYPGTFEFEITGLKGGHRWLETHAVPLKDTTGKIVKLLGVTRDITVRKKDEKEKKQLAERLRLATKSAQLGIWDWDIKNNVLTWDEGMYRLYNITANEFNSLHEGWISRLHPEDRQHVQNEMELALANKKDYKPEFRIVWSDLSVHYLNASGIIERDNDGNAIRIIGVNWDVTAEKEKERHLKLLESVITNTTDSVMITEAESFGKPGLRIVFVNEAFTKMTGYSSEEIIGITPRILQGPKSDKEELKRFSEAIRKWQPCEITTVNYKKNGEEYWVNISVSPVANERGWYTHWISIERDVTERKLAEIHLNELNTNLQNYANSLAISNTELEHFAFVASHDLQEPLRMVTSFLSLLEKKYADVIDDNGKAYIGFAVDGAKRMKQIILDLLEYSRAGRVEDAKEELDLNNLINEIKILLGKEIAEKQAVFTIDQLPKIHAYRSAMRQVFQNLINNALKYCNKEIPVQIQITVKALEQHWQFAVIDNGIGIGKEYFDKIFIIFQRLHTREAYSGTGMGLSIIKKIIEMQGGKIWVESEEGKGSTFYFTIKK